MPQQNYNRTMRMEYNHFPPFLEAPQNLPCHNSSWFRWPKNIS